MEEDRETVVINGIKISKETIEKCNIAKNYIEGRIIWSLERYEKFLEKERYRVLCWNMLNKKMKDLQLSKTEQQIIKEDFMKHEAQLFREK